ncbi:hypothetical protein [Fusobacterium periodonticum]|jgi:hypothetical protein|uniref:Uncharacterized protein n=1 Tax=Fusobacterium periodonticum D10 TaxID=620833 RepID=K1GJ78_9FUSO|nr:hypothetical protein [Fusobacterium periodonticum]EKA93410.1 hypothetical protein FPOG_00315 [Fusobacterium periodonticum D10]
MAKSYILNIKDTNGNWVGIPNLIGQKGETGLTGARGVDGVGITNITQQDKKLIVDLSNNTRKEFTIPSTELLSGSDLLNKITNEVPTNSPSITNFKTHLNIPSTTDIKTIQDMSFVDNKLKLTMSDNTSKEVTIKSGGIEFKTLFEGRHFFKDFTLENIPTEWKYIFITIVVSDGYTMVITGCNRPINDNEVHYITNNVANRSYGLFIKVNTLYTSDMMRDDTYVVKVQVII